jgi:acyl-CoA thioesterase
MEQDPLTEKLRAVFQRDRFAARAGIELVSLAAGQAVVQMRVTPDHWNGLESAHGGAIFTLADFAFAVAANSYGTVAVAVNVSITYQKAVASGLLRAEAREIAKNFKLGIYTVTVTDEQGDLVALFQGLAYRKSEPPPPPAPAA